MLPVILIYTWIEVSGRLLAEARTCVMARVQGCQMTSFWTSGPIISVGANFKIKNEISGFSWHSYCITMNNIQEMTLWHLRITLPVLFRSRLAALTAIMALFNFYLQCAFVIFKDKHNNKRRKVCITTVSLSYYGKKC